MQGQVIRGQGECHLPTTDPFSFQSHISLHTSPSSFLVFSPVFYRLGRLNTPTSFIFNDSSAELGTQWMSPLLLLKTWQIFNCIKGMPKMQHVQQMKNNKNNNFIFFLSSCRWCTPQLIIALLIRLVPLHISATSQSSSGTSVPNSTKQEAH